MGRRRDTESPEEAPAICQRFDWLLRNEFGNSITQMAAALGVSHTALSRVINKGQMPSGQMLEGVAKLNRVNLHWLLAGGEEKSPHPDGGSRFVSVSDRLLLAAPRSAPDLLDPMVLPTSSPFLLGDPYWFRVPTDSPLLTRPKERVAPGDYLLVETGRAWTSRSSAHARRLLVLRGPTPSAGVLARVGDEDILGHVEDAGVRFALDTFGVVEQAVLFTELKRDDAGRRGTKGAEVAADERTFFADDVVGIVLEKRTLYGRAGQ